MYITSLPPRSSPAVPHALPMQARTSGFPGRYLETRTDQVVSRPDDERVVMNERVSVLNSQFDEMLRREVDSRKISFIKAVNLGQAASAAALQARNNGAQDDPKLIFNDVRWVSASLAMVSFIAGNGQMYEVRVDRQHADFALLKNYELVRHARGPVNALRDDTLDALLQAPADAVRESQPQVLEAYVRARGLRDVNARLVALAHPGPGRWVPSLACGKNPNDGKNYAFLVNLDHPAQTIPVVIDDPSVIGKLEQFKRFSTQQFAAVTQGFPLGHGRIVPKAGVKPQAALDAMQGLLKLDLLKNWLTIGSAQDDDEKDDLLSVLQGHLSNAQFTLGLTDEALQLVEFGAGATGAASFAAGAARLRDVAGKVGLLVSAVTLALSIAALIKSTHEERIAMLPRLAFEAGGLGLGVVGLAGGATVSGVAGALALPLAGLSIGIDALYTHFSAIARETRTFAAEVLTMHDNLKAGGMVFNAEDQSLKPLTGVVIEALDLKNQRVDFGSPSIYSTRFKGGESGNLIVWVGNQPEVEHDRSRMIDIRERLGLAARADLPDGALSATTVHLPATPKSLIDYRYRPFPAVTLRNDAGFALLRAMEREGDFAFDFQCGHEQAIADVEYNYQPTTVRVALGSVGYRLQMPQLGAAVQGKLHYALQADSGQQTIGLMPGARLSLSSGSPKHTQWVLDARNLNSDQVSIEDNEVYVGGVRIDLPADQRDARVTVINKQGESIVLNLRNPWDGASAPVLPRAALRV